VARVVVLLGPPGSGKTTIGEELGRRGLRWREWEPVILARWGSREAFVARKTEALPQLHDEVGRWVAAGGPAGVIETTDLSDAPLLDTLDRDHECLVVRLDVSRAEARRRVAARAGGRHLTDDPGRNDAVWQAVAAGPGTHRRVDLVLATDQRTPADLAEEILAACAPPTQGHPAAGASP
jgi:shikimate kinase